jgi:signal-transduction protein with cAMP-binding, CBS, and nucleotidyltransferase domain
MWEADCGFLPVVADDGKVLGVITDRDIAIALGTRPQLAAEIAVNEVMSEKLYACSPSDNIHAALKTMRKDRVRRLPVVNDEGGLEGILSMNDVAIHAEKFDQHKTVDLSYEDVVNTFKAICEHHQPAKVDRVKKVDAAT